MTKVKPEMPQSERFAGGCKNNGVLSARHRCRKGKTTVLFLCVCFVFISNHSRIKELKAKTSLLIPAIANINAGNCYY